MPSPRFPAVFRPFCALLLSALLCCAQAAELGEPVVRSYLGQPLVADIELTALADPAAAVAVRLASPDVYKGANIAMHPALASLTLSVMRRDGRQFLHVTSLRPVDSDMIHLFLDLVEGNRRNVRAVTLWLTPDPTPAPKPLPAPVPVPVPVAPPAALIAPPRAPAPPKNVPASEQTPPAERTRPARVISLPPAVAACPPATLTAEQVKTCAAVDYKNGLLSAQIVELEEKVKQLQLAVEGKADTPPAAAKPAPPPPPPPPIRAAKPAPAADAGFPWLIVAGAVLALAVIGGAVWFFLSRRKGRAAEAAAADSVAWYTRLTGMLRRKPKTAPVAAEAPTDA
jgi:hypothetical protein